MRIGFLGGSFDPIHLGHLNLAKEMQEKYALDEIWFSPAKISPFKADAPPHISDEERLKLLQIALEDYPAFKIYDKELKREGLSYTVETLEELVKEYPRNQFFLIMGEDTAQTFSKWKDPKRIEELASLLVGERSELSSTLIRKQLKNNLDVSSYLPEKIIDYISLHRLYL